MANTSILIRAENIKKYYYKKGLFLPTQKIETIAVDGVNLAIKKNSIVGLVGESGSGKSTLGHTLLNLKKATKGQVKFNDEVLFDVDENFWMPEKKLSKMRKDIQLIFQNSHDSLSPSMMVYDIVKEGLIKHKICTKSQAYDRIIELFLKCNLDKNILYKYPYELSGGQKQRVSIARSFILKPQFIVCDEPTASLDLPVQAKILNLFLELKEEYKSTYLFISHNLNLVSYFCDEIYTMYKGRIIEKGLAKDVYKNPIHPYTHMLIESIPAYLYGGKKPQINLPKQKKESSIHIEINQGCSYVNKCKYAMPICYENMPILSEIGNKRAVACHLYV